MAAVNGLRTLEPMESSVAIRTARTVALVLLAWLLAVASSWAQVFDFNQGNAAGWTLSGAFTAPASGSPVAPASHAFTFQWDDLTNYPNPVGLDPRIDNNGSLELQTGANGTGISGRTSPLDVWWIMRAVSPDLSTNTAWQRAAGFSVRLNTTLGSTPIVPRPIYVTFDVRVFDQDAQQERLLSSGTRQQLPNAPNGVWSTLTFNWASLATFPTRYILRDLRINVWGQLTSEFQYSFGALYIDDVAPIALTSVTPRRGPTAGGTAVVVRGSGFFATGAAVTVGGVPASTVSVVSPTELQFVTPPGTAGSAPIVLTSSGLTARSTFDYVATSSRTHAGARKPSFSFDGRYMALQSPVAQLPEDTNGVSDIYIFDRSTSVLRRVSISSLGTQAVGGESLNADISASGRFITFDSRASNLVPGDTNGLLDVFLHDRDADNDGVFDEPGAISTTRVSVASDGAQAIGGSSRFPSISGNGRWVAFESAATNLDAPDGNNLTDIFVHDRFSGRTRRVSISTGGAEAIGGPAARAAISLDGRWIAFDSSATNLVANDTNGRRDVFLHDRDGDTDGVMDEPGFRATSRVSVGTNPVGTNNVQALNGDSSQPSITQQGRWVAFSSTAANLVPGDTNGESDVFLHDRVTQVTVRVSVGPGGQFIGPSSAPKISATGSRLLFLTSGLNGPGTSTSFSPSSHVVAGGADDGKTTTGEVDLPTAPTPPPAGVPPPDATTNDQDPDISGDGSEAGNTAEPIPGGATDDPSIQIEGPEPPPAGSETPFITGLSPAQGPIGGGIQVAVEGANFAGGDVIGWGGSVIAGQLVTNALMRTTAPTAGGPASVEVFVRSGTEDSNTMIFTYQTGVSSPVVTGLTSTSGPTSGGQSLTIQGTGFASPSVRFGPRAATVQASTPTSITLVTPPADTAGPVPVVVTNGDGSIGVSNGPYLYALGAAAAAPTIASVQPGNGAAAGGTAITITGANFVAGTTVTIGGQAASLVQVLSNSAISAVTPPGSPGTSASVAVTAPGLAPQLAPSGFNYLATASQLAGCVTGNDSDGDTLSNEWEEQFGLSPGDPADAAVDFDRDGRTNVQECQDGTHPRGAYTRFLAEGATGTFFTTRIAVGNPNANAARVLLRFQTGDNRTVPFFLMVPAMSRSTVDVEALAGLESANVSTVIEADAEVVVDRTMQWDRVSRFGAHAESSVAAPANLWYLAEGATHGFFDLFYLIQNPSLTDTAQIRIRFIRAVGDPIEHVYTVLPSSRFTLPVDGIPGLEAADVSAVIESTNAVPIIVERAMYSSAAGPFAAGHDSAGVTQPSTQWFLAEGATGSYFDLFMLFANPNTSDAIVEATYLLPGGSTVVKSYTVPANRRVTINVAGEDPLLADTAVSVKILSTNAVPIIVERSMWWPHSQPWFEAHNSPGSSVTGTKWAVGDGEVGGAPHFTQTYLLVANTSPSVAELVVTILPENGAPLTKTFSVPGNSRFNVPVASEFPATQGTRFSAVVESVGATPAQIVVERAMYWDANGVIWATGSNVLATRLH